MKIAVISMQERIENPKGIPFGDLYQQIGLNSGNLMFTNAVFRQINGELVRIGFYFSPQQINREFDAVVIPAANWINSDSNWDWFSDLLERIEIPVITIGIGLQAQSSDNDSVQVNESSMRLIKILASKSPYVSTRGHFTRNWLYSQGIKNVVATGCPSLYLTFRNDNSAAVVDKRDEVIVQSTRFYTSAAFNNTNDINTRLYKLAYQMKAQLVFQSEAEEMMFLIHGVFDDNEEIDTKKASLLTDLYGADTVDSLKEYLINHGNVFFDIDLWSRFVSQYRYVIGTRVHGSIVALLSGVSSLLIVHDSRTQELAEFAGIPFIFASEVMGKDIFSLDEMRRLVPENGLERFYRLRNENIAIYRQFIESVGLSLRI